MLFRSQRKPPFPFIPGLPLTGIVTEVAHDETRVKPGDRVIAALDYGAYAEEAVAQEDNCFCIPDEMELQQPPSFLLTTARPTAHSTGVPN